MNEPLTLFKFLETIQEYQRKYFLSLQMIISSTTFGVNVLIIANDGDYRMFTASAIEDEYSYAETLDWIDKYIIICLNKKKDETSQTLF